MAASRVHSGVAVILLAACRIWAAEVTEAKLQDAITAAAGEAREIIAGCRRDPMGAAPRLVQALERLAEARRLSEKAGDTESLCDIEAGILWCRRQLADQEVRGQASAEVAERIEQAEQATAVVEQRPAPPAEADASLAAAVAAAAQRPQDHLSNSLRFFAVAERFAGSSAAIKAQRLSLAEHEAFLRAAQQEARAALFSAVGPVVAQVPMPAVADLRAQTVELKRSYAAGYADQGLAGRRVLARQLLDQALRHRGDLVRAAASLQEVVRLGVETDEVAVIEVATGLMGSWFAGYDVAAARSEAMARLGNKAVAKAMLVLAGDQNDPMANGVVGRHIALELGDWDAALPLLVKCDDPAWARVARMELAVPRRSAERMVVAMAWRDIMRAALRPEERLVIGRRAMCWCVAAREGAEGEEERGVERLAGEIKADLPYDMTGRDYAGMTPVQWDMLKGAVVAVSARPDRMEGLILLRQGERVRLVPHPQDVWRIESAARVQVPCTWRGVLGRDGDIGDRGIEGIEPRRGDQPTGCLLAWIDNRPPVVPTGVFAGPGRITLGANKMGINNGAKGEIRVKVVALEGE